MRILLFRGTIACWNKKNLLTLYLFLAKGSEGTYRIGKLYCPLSLCMHLSSTFSNDFSFKIADPIVTKFNEACRGKYSTFLSFFHGVDCFSVESQGLGWGNERLFKWSGSHDKHWHQPIWAKNLKNFLSRTKNLKALKLSV